MFVLCPTHDSEGKISFNDTVRVTMSMFSKVPLQFL
jgi:hypothetical protein